MIGNVRKNIYMKHVIVLFVAMFSLYTYANISGDSISVTSSVNRSTITIGDRISYKIDVSYSEGLKVQAPSIGANLDSFEIKDYRFTSPKKEHDGQIHETFEYIMSIFSVGDYVVPPVSITYIKKDSSKVSKIFTDRINIKVISVKPNDSGDIKDIKSVVEIKGGISAWLYYLLAIILVIAVFVAWRVFKSKHKEENVVPSKPPYEKAIEAIEKLASENLIEKGYSKAFNFRISEIIRIYLGERYTFNAIDLTTTELLEELHRADIKDDVIENVKSFCNVTDMVKFADYKSSLSEDKKILDDARKILAMSKPVVSVQNKEDKNV